MQSGQVNASQLLGAFLGSVKAKLGQAITKNDFSGELKKHLSKQLNATGTPELEGGGAVKTEASAAALTDVSAAASKVSTTASAVASEVKTGASQLEQGKGLTDSSVKIKDLKSKAKTEKSLFLSNPAIIETILANLHYPAKIRDRCAALLNKQGHISIQDLRSILGVRPDTVSGAGGEVPAAAVRTLLGSIVKVSGTVEGKAAAVGKSFKTSVAIKPDGSYTREELRGLLEKVIQESQKTNSKVESATLSSSTHSTVKTKTTESLKTEQAEALVSSVLPSFISAGRKVAAEKVLGGAAKKGGEVPEAEGKRTDWRENPVKAVSNGSGSRGGAIGEKKGSSSGNGQSVAPGVEAAAHGGENGPSRATASPSQAGQTDAAGAAMGIAAELAEWMKAAGSSAQSDPGASGATTGPDSLKEVEGRAASGGQDTPVLGKDIEKLSGGKDQPSENGVLQTAGAQREDNPITLPQMNNSGGDGFVFYDRNRTAELAQDVRGAKTTGASDTSSNDKGIEAVLASYISTEDETGSETRILTGNHDNQKSDARGANKKDSGGHSVKDVFEGGKSGEQSGSDKAAPVGGGEGSARGVEAGLNGAGNGSLKATVVEKLTALDPSALEGQGGTAAAAKRSDGQAAGKDAFPGPAVVRASATNLQAMNGNPAGTSAQSGPAGSFAYRAEQANSKDSEQSAVEAVSKSAKADGRTGSDKAAPVGGTATGGSVGAGINGGANGPSNASASAWSLSQQEAVSMPAGVMDQGAQSGEAQSSSSLSEKNATQGVTATTAAGRLTSVEQSVLGRQAVAVAAKRSDEPSAEKASSPAAAVLQASPSNFQTIHMHPGGNSAQSGFAPYDPYRAVELANSVREQSAGGVGRQLVLEMDPEGLGKISLKVEARKDEISVAALTQNEPARQALMSHTVDLRQDLRNQGLVLGKFMVDVNAGNPNPGGESGSGAHQSGDKGKGTFKATKAVSVKQTEAPVRAAAARGLSQISIFA